MTSKQAALLADIRTAVICLAVCGVFVTLYLIAAGS